MSRFSVTTLIFVNRPVFMLFLNFNASAPKWKKSTNSHFRVQLKKQSHTGLEQHENEKKIIHLTLQNAAYYLATRTLFLEDQHRKQVPFVILCNSLSLQLMINYVHSLMISFW